MGEQTSLRPWWHDLKLKAETAEAVNNRQADSPAWLAEDIRRFQSLGAAARADLARAVAAHLRASPKDEAGFQDLLEALEEADGKRPAKALTKPDLAFGYAPNPVPQAAPPPVPPNLGDLKRKGRGKP
jgi:hypothetical protein